MEMPKRVMTIAGSNPRGAAGIQADLKTFQEHDVYGMAVITAIVARHPQTNKNVHLLDLDAIEAQFHLARTQIGIDALKTGMLFSKEIIETVAELIREANIEHVVIDPVMVGKMKSKLLKDDAIAALKEKLIPLATVITPNIHEASVLLDNRSIDSVDAMKQAAVDLYNLGAKNVLVKGGRLSGPAMDVLYDGEMLTVFEAPRIDTENTSGAGCSYSAAIAANLAKGLPLKEAVHHAKSFITTAIQYGFSYDGNVGPTYHAAKRLFGETYEVKVEEEMVN